MDTPAGKDHEHLINDLIAHGPEYNTFYAIFIAEVLSKKWHPNRDDDKLDQLGLNFRPFEMYVYPPKDIRGISLQGDVLTFVINFMGLYGINSPLPRCYHEPVAIQQKTEGAGQVPLQNFLDIFNNRFYWLYYQAWKKYRYYLHVSSSMHHPMAQRVMSFIGRGIHSNPANTQISIFQLLSLSGVLCHRVRNREGLRIIIQEFFPRFPLKIREFVPRMVSLTDLTALGRKQNKKPFLLGKQGVLGRSIRTVMSRICLEMGPMDFEDYLSFIPGSRNALILKELLDLYLCDGLEFDVKFIIRSETIQSVQWNDPRLQLGISLWLGIPEDPLVEVVYPFERFVETVSENVG